MGKDRVSDEFGPKKDNPIEQPNAIIIPAGYSDIPELIQKNPLVIKVGSDARPCTAEELEKVARAFANDGLTISKLQEDQWVWTKKNFPNQPKHHPLLGVGEEVGELNHAILKMEQGIRGTKEMHMEEAKDAVGDIMVYLAGVCNHYGLDMQECIEMAWGEVSGRDWIENPDAD